MVRDLHAIASNATRALAEAKEVVVEGVRRGNWPTLIGNCGHGGLLPDGTYVTAPDFDPQKPHTWHKSFYHDDSGPIFEGQINREIGAHFWGLCTAYDIPIRWVNGPDSVEDMPLGQIVMEANTINREVKKNALFISFHNNASESHQALGGEVFTRRGDDPADPIAEYIVKEKMSMAEYGYEQRHVRINSHQKLGKEADYAVLVGTKYKGVYRKAEYAGILTEDEFFDHPEGARFLKEPKNQRALATFTFVGLAKYFLNNRMV